ncbi:hypothetical protein RchiOBHm_Chr2g0135871 [Rosa chinensis]|uniref:Uncharacterized protein n=1 Tax=Rosa chinensis TaxID=74649 RepID=A0A2P6RW61_ROSCH|nr:hypothetical protein RchiOBHm_Chr2g0135871 [Rosa chinensis]
MTAICRQQWTLGPRKPHLTSPPESNFVYTGWSGISKISNSKVSIPELSSLPKGGKCLLSPRLEGPVSRSFWSQSPHSEICNHSL